MKKSTWIINKKETGKDKVFGDHIKITGTKKEAKEIGVKKYGLGNATIRAAMPEEI